MKRDRSLQNSRRDAPRATGRTNSTEAHSVVPGAKKGDRTYPLELDGWMHHVITGGSESRVATVLESYNRSHDAHASTPYSRRRVGFTSVAFLLR